MKSNDIIGKWALVTGASSGLGADFARVLASLGCQLILTARRRDRLDQINEEITGQYGVSVLTIPLDLVVPESPRQLYDQIKAQGIRVDVLINNAAILNQNSVTAFTGTGGYTCCGLGGIELYIQSISTRPHLTPPIR
jgi:short-subunit dehydrogenase